MKTNPKGQYEKLIRLVALTAALFVCAAASAQTNWFPGGEIVVSAAPTITFTGFGSGHFPRTFGYSIETEYWLNAWTGSGLEAGAYNVQGAEFGCLDHISAVQHFRIVPFPGSIFWSRLAIGAKTEAETYLTDGSKDVGVGAEGWFTLSKRFRFEGEIIERTSGKGLTGKLEIQFRF